MTEQKQEPLNVEEPKPEEKPAIDVDSLVSELERAGITNADELSGKLRASQETGRLAQLLGDERKRTAEYETKLRELENRPAPKQDFMDYNEGSSIDIENLMRKTTREEVRAILNEEKESRRIAQEQDLKKWNFIRSDKDYGIVKEIWEDKLKDPNFIYQVQSGAIDPVQDYNETKIEYYKTLLQKSHETITTMQGKGKVSPPHVESGERTSANIVSESENTSAVDKRLAELREKTEKGHLLTNEEELEMIDLLFGTTAPL